MSLIKKVLLIDDEKELCVLTAGRLRRAGFEVDTCTSAKIAMEKMTQSAGYCAVVTDHRLGDGSSEEILRKVFALGTPYRVIIVTGVPDLEIESNLKPAVVDIFYKPVNFPALIQALKQASQGDE